METSNHGNSDIRNRANQNLETDKETNTLGNSNLRNEGRLGGASGNYDALHSNQNSKNQVIQSNDETLTDDDNDFDFDNNDLDEKDNDWDDDNWSNNQTDTDLSTDRDL